MKIFVIEFMMGMGNTDSFEGVLQRWRAIGITVSIWQARDLKLRPPTPEKNAFQLD